MAHCGDNEIITRKNIGTNNDLCGIWQALILDGMNEKNPDKSDLL